MPKQRNYINETKYEETPTQVKHREARNRARSRYEKEHGPLPKGVDIDHKTPLARGGSNAVTNTRPLSVARNRGWRKGKKGYTP